MSLTTRHREASTIDQPVLRRGLSSRQVGMIGLGGAIGTGLFLGSGLAISFAGPAVIVAYLVASIGALVLAYALAEMIAAHPQSNGFGSITTRYLGPGMGFVQRWTYWFAQVINVGGEAIAVGLYLRFWWPAIPLWIPVVVFSGILLGVNALAVRLFGEFEYWFAAIKVFAIIVFVALGVIAITVGLPGHAATGLAHLTEHGGFAPNGLTGIWLGITAVTFGFLGTEAVAVTAGESRDPGRDIPRAARRMVLRLALFYVLAIIVVVATTSWVDVANSNGLQTSPFVRLFSTAGVPAAAGLVNFVILTAALSSMNTNLYVATRMGYSLAQDGFAPAWMAIVNRHGAPHRALATSAVGLVCAVVVSVVAPTQAFAAMVGIALFSALVTWLIIFATHISFRRSYARQGLSLPSFRLPGAPWTTALALVFFASVLMTTAWTDQFASAWWAGLPFLALLTAAYLVVRRTRSRDRHLAQSTQESGDGSVASLPYGRGR